MMNYFELYDLPVSFNPNQQQIKQKFYELSKKYHPDFFINESEEKQEEVLTLSTLNNKAFQVLKDDQKRLHYVLELKQQLVEGENYILPQSFLMEMMEVNEALMDLQFDPDQESLKKISDQIIEIEANLSKELQELTMAFDGQDDENEKIVSLGAIKDVYYRNKYIARIKESLNKQGKI